jgi:hypothetical protein
MPIKVVKILYTLECSCGSTFLAERTENKKIFFKCPGCEKKGGITGGQKLAPMKK